MEYVDRWARECLARLPEYWPRDLKEIVTACRRLDVEPLGGELLDRISDVEPGVLFGLCFLRTPLPPTQNPLSCPTPSLMSLVTQGQVAELRLDERGCRGARAGISPALSS